MLSSWGSSHPLKLTVWFLSLTSSWSPSPITPDAAAPALGPGAPRVPFLSAKRDQRITLCRENGHRGPGWLMAKVPLTLVCKTASYWNLTWPHGPSWESMLLDLLEVAP